MKTFKYAMTTDDVLGENLMPTHSISGSALVDLFFTMGAARSLPEDRIIRLLQLAIDEDPLLAMKAIFYNRDIRGGQGERRSFRVFINYLANYAPDSVIANLENISKYGRWDDLFSVFNTPVEKYAIDFILSALKRGDKLCAKWMPRDNKAGKDIALKLMKAFGLSRGDYRRLLSGNTEVVETLMCSNRWNDIRYPTVPSIAMANYRKSFFKHDADRFSEFLTKVEKGEEKIHADAIFPHTLVGKYDSFGGVDRTLEAQWKALPNYVPEGESIIPICDVSGSMNGIPMLVSVSLGIYLSERNIGPFKDMFITFSDHPVLQLLSGDSLRAKIYELETSKWAMNTNLEAVFRLILGQAQKHSLPPEEMPKTVLILSDMQFDQCINQPHDNAFTMIKRMYAESGYSLPQVVFWNLRTSTGIPVKFDEKGTALVSGFSPSIMKNVLSGEMSPINIVLATLNSTRYDSVVL